MRLLVLSLFINVAAASEFEMGAGSITAHFWNNKVCGPRYENKLNERGLIANQLNSFSLINKNIKHSLFIGQNSVGELMTGYSVTNYTYKTKSIRFGFFAGAYYQDTNEFIERGLYLNSPLGDIVPVVGAELGITVYKHKNLSVGINNNVTPILSIHSLFFNISF